MGGAKPHHLPPQAALVEGCMSANVEMCAACHHVEAHADCAELITDSKAPKRYFCKRCWRGRRKRGNRNPTAHQGARPPLD